LRALSRSERESFLRNHLSAILFEIIILTELGQYEKKKANWPFSASSPFP